MNETTVVLTICAISLAVQLPFVLKSVRKMSLRLVVKTLLLTLRLCKTRDIRPRIAAGTVLFAIYALGLLLMSTAAGQLILDGKYWACVILLPFFAPIHIVFTVMRQTARLMLKWRRYKTAATFKKYQEVKKMVKRMTHRELLRYYEECFKADGDEMPYMMKIKMVDEPFEKLRDKTIIAYTLLSQNPRLGKKNFDEITSGKINHIALIRKYS